MCSAAGVERQSDWPVGALLACAHGTHDADMYWICADPVHLAVDRDSLILQPHAQLQLSEPESRALFATMEAHFAAAGLRMLHVDSGRWCFGSPRHPQLTTFEPELVEGRNINDVLPRGEDSAEWQRYITEAQMLLHDHPVNVLRESRGEPVVNSLWLWGGGRISAPHKAFDRMLVHDALARAIGTLSGSQMSAPARRPEDFFDDGDSLAEFPALAPDNGENVLARLDSSWMVPAWRALRTGGLDKFTLVLRQPAAIVECSCDRQARRRFWTRTRPLSATLKRFQGAV